MLRQLIAIAFISTAGVMSAQCNYNGRTKADHYNAATPSEAVHYFWVAASDKSEVRALSVVSPPPESFLRVCGAADQIANDKLPYTRVIEKPENTAVPESLDEPESLLSTRQGFDFTIASNFKNLGAVGNPSLDQEIIDTSIFEDEAVVTTRHRSITGDHLKRYYYLVRTDSGWKVIGVYFDLTLMLLPNPGYGTSKSCRDV